MAKEQFRDWTPSGELKVSYKDAHGSDRIWKANQAELLESVQKPLKQKLQDFADSLAFSAHGCVVGAAVTESNPFHASSPITLSYQEYHGASVQHEHVSPCCHGNYEVLQQGVAS